MTGELFDGTLLTGAYVVVLSTVLIALVFSVFNYELNRRNPPTKRDRQHPEW